mmetsp:Transcript_21014/g.46682  ORF Transcript_21014/g.46682 Transcript_21014/m.46682 type:complete len:220 (-) Transcript_21014:830-1489(-)
MGGPLHLEEHDGALAEGAADERQHHGVHHLLVHALCLARRRAHPHELLHQPGSEADTARAVLAIRAVLPSDAHPHRPLQAHLDQVLHSAGHGCGEEHGLSGHGAVAHELLHLLLEAHLQQPVGLVQHQHVQVVQRHGAGVAQVVQHATGSADHYVWSAAQRDLLTPHVLLASADEHAGHVRELRQLLQHLVDLQGELSRGRDHQHADGGHVARPEEQPF